MVDKKACIKEGGKKGVDVCGMCDLGGVKFFNVTIDGANGELEALDFVLEGMNAPVDETAEERKGGAGHLGKMLYSAADGGAAFAILCNIPKALQTESPAVTIGAWVLNVMKALVGTTIKKVETSDETVKVLVECDTANGIFPLKVRDAAQEQGFAFLREAGCLPAGDDDDEDYVPDLEAEGITW